MSSSYQEYSCTLCQFKTDNERVFNDHLLKTHRFTLKSARNSVDYNLKKRIPREISRFQCKRCQKQYPISSRLRDHKVSCEIKFKEKMMNRLKQGLISCLYCSDCFMSKEDLDQHLETCSKPKMICCQLCPFETLISQMPQLQNHIWTEHNLICKPVKEAQFLQAINGTPYTLQRVPALDALPTITEAKALELMKCWKCNMQFANVRLLTKHERRRICTGADSPPNGMKN